MDLEKEDIVAIEKILDDRYVLKKNCDEKRSSVYERLANDDKRIEVVMHDFATIKRLIWTVASATIGQMVLSLFDLLKGV